MSDYVRLPSKPKKYQFGIVQISLQSPKEHLSQVLLKYFVQEAATESVYFIKIPERFLKDIDLQ